MVSIDYRTSDRGSAIAGEHFEMVSGTLAWADGDKTPKIIKVPLLGEPGGTRANLDFGVVLENLQGNAMYDATRGRVVLKERVIVHLEMRAVFFSPMTSNSIEKIGSLGLGNRCQLVWEYYSCRF